MLNRLELVLIALASFFITFAVRPVSDKSKWISFWFPEMNFYRLEVTLISYFVILIFFGGGYTNRTSFLIVGLGG